MDLLIDYICYLIVVYVFALMLVFVVVYFGLGYDWLFRIWSGFVYCCSYLLVLFRVKLFIVVFGLGCLLIVDFAVVVFIVCLFRFVLGLFVCVLLMCVH